MPCIPVHMPMRYTCDLLIKLDHHIRHLHILLCDVLASDLEDDVLLVVRDLLLANVFHELRQSAIYVSVLLSTNDFGSTYFMGSLSLFLACA